MTSPRIKIALILILSIIGHKCDTISDMKADMLLRGGGEELTPEDIEVPLIKDIEPDKTITEEEKKTIDTKEEVKTTDAKEEEVTSTTEAPATEENQEFRGDLYTTTLTDNTEDNVYSHDGFDNIGNSDSTSETTSPRTSTTKMAEDIETASGASGAGVVGLDDDHDFSPRVPKLSDNPEPKQQDKRDFETKQAATPMASKSSTLRGWLQDTWLRPPAGILVPLRPMALNRALAVWNDLTAEGLNVTDIVVVGYDANGVNWRSRHNLHPASNKAGQKTVAEALSKLLLKYQNVNIDASDGTMRALASAAKLVPYDSALFVVTDKGAGDIQRLPLTLRALVEKRLKVYIIWTDPAYPSAESEVQLQSLRNVSKHTEGEVLPYSLQVMDMEAKTGKPQHWESLEMPQARKGKVHDTTEDDNYDTLLVRRGGGEAISLGVPVENGVSVLRIYIEGLVEHAVLYPPNDAPQVDLYNLSSVLAFSPQSRTDGLSPRDVYLVFPGADAEGDVLSVLPMKPSIAYSPAPTVGVWHLSVRCDTCDYRLCVSARSHIHFRTRRLPADKLNMRVEGPVASVRETVLIDEYGVELAKLPFNYQPQSIATDGQDGPQEGPPPQLIDDVALPSVKGSRVYAKIVGRDIRGEPFTRLSGPLNQEVRLERSASVAFPDSNDLERAEEYNSKVYKSRLQYNESSIVPFERAVSQVTNQLGSLLTAVQIGLSSRLYGAPGATLQLHFEVTNFREQPVFFSFKAVGELNFLRGMAPLSRTVASGETVNVIVTVGITNNAQPGARDFITFTASSRLEQVSISTYVYVINDGQVISDVWPPEMWHDFQGSCIGRLGNDCAQYVWSVTVRARDANAGLLRLSSSPVGLMYDSNFIAGSREEVRAVYRATCCAPRVVVTAVDANGNANSYVIDISGYLTEAGIAAIVLGVFLLIAIIALVVFLIYWCVKRRKESRELPYSTSTSRNLN